MKCFNNMSTFGCFRRNGSEYKHLKIGAKINIHKACGNENDIDDVNDQLL